MFINNKDLKQFNAKLLNKRIYSNIIQVNQKWLKQALLPVFIDSKVKYKKINLEILIKGKNELETEINTSNLITELINCTIVFKNLDIYYKCFITEENNISKTYSKNKIKLTVDLIAYAFLKQEIIKIENKNYADIFNKGNTDTPCVIEIIPEFSIIDFTIKNLTSDEIKIKNLTKDKKITLDGINKLIVEEEKNKFKDIDLWEYPFLKKGNNHIEFSRDNCIVVIKFNPRLI